MLSPCLLHAVITHLRVVLNLYFMIQFVMTQKGHFKIDFNTVTMCNGKTMETCTETC